MNCSKCVSGTYPDWVPCQHCNSAGEIQDGQYWIDKNGIVAVRKWNGWYLHDLHEIYPFEPIARMKEVE